MRNNPIDRFMRWIYIPAIFITIFTGFGNMPLYKRYFIADLPGMSWSGNFYSNMMVHYIAGALVLMTSFYFAAGFITQQRRLSLSGSGRIRSILLAVALLSGGLMALKNLPFFHFQFPMLMASNFLHLGSAMLFLLISIICVVLRRKWIAR